MGLPPGGSRRAADGSPLAWIRRRRTRLRNWSTQTWPVRSMAKAWVIETMRDWRATSSVLTWIDRQEQETWIVIYEVVEPPRPQA